MFMIPAVFLVGCATPETPEPRTGVTDAEVKRAMMVVLPSDLRMRMREYPGYQCPYEPTILRTAVSSENGNIRERWTITRCGVAKDRYVTYRSMPDGSVSIIAASGP